MKVTYTATIEVRDGETEESLSEFQDAIANLIDGMRPVRAIVLKDSIELCPHRRHPMTEQPTDAGRLICKIGKQG